MIKGSKKEKKIKQQTEELIEVVTVEGVYQEKIKETDIVKIKDGKPMTCSLMIAEVFGKEHNDVLKKVRANIEFFNEGNFSLVEYNDTKGETRPMYLLDRDFASFIIMGFTGKKVIEWKLKYIKMFNEMEKALLEQSGKTTPKNYKEALYLLIEQEEERERILLENKTLQEDIGCLSGEILSWTNRKELGHAVRVLSSRIGKVEGKIWNELYRELYYKHSIQLRARGDSPYVQHIKDNEWELVTKSFSAICVNYGENPSEVFNR